MADEDTKPPAWTDSDRIALDHARKELREHEHRAWLWALLTRIAKWALAVVAGTTVVADAIVRLFTAWRE